MYLNLCSTGTVYINVLATSAKALWAHVSCKRLINTHLRYITLSELKSCVKIEVTVPSSSSSSSSSCEATTIMMLIILSFYGGSVAQYFVNKLF